jgi:2-succinyl-5-enolpyruvyl-6-hydroxy-3-cyclohexene-1-carboxylate synthase
VNDLDVTTSFARTLVDEWVRNGLTAAVVSPGSRNTPLTLALVRDGRVRVDVVLDERSAGFRALGIGLATGRPAVVCCTSGTAAVNLHPAVVEAHHARVPLLVCTADRPAELRDRGAGQTIDQTHLFGRAVRWFHDPGPPDAYESGSPGATADGATAERWRALACRSIAETVAAPAGPVHLNLPFREPLVPTGAELLDAPGRPGGAPWIRTAPIRREPLTTDVRRIAELVRAHPRGLLVAGWGSGVTPTVADAFAAGAGWPIVADPLSQLRAGSAIATYEALVRVDAFARDHRPDLVVRVGAPLTSKVANAWLAGVPTVLVDPDGVWLDPHHDAVERIGADADALLVALAAELGEGALAAGAPALWAGVWQEAEARARRALDSVFDDDIPCEGRVARDVAAAVPDGGTLVVASSLPVRALEWCMAPRRGLRVLANRGANGIDGFPSTVVGIARVAGGPVVALCGDLCLLHDTNGLLGGASLPPATFVVVDNDGGRIFSYLPQHELPEFETLFATPQAVDLVAVARAHGVAAERVELRDLAKLVAAGSETARVLVVTVDGASAREQHARGWRAVATALG